MPEYERPQRRDARQTPAEAAHAEFLSGPQMMFANFESLVFNFGWTAAQIAGDPDAPRQMRAMLEFAIAYQQFGLETAWHAIQQESGIPVQILVGEDGKRSRTHYKEGLLTGLVGARHAGRVKLFDGVAVIDDERGRQRFVAVIIKSDGSTELHPDQCDYSKHDLISDKPIEEIFPPSHQRRPIS